MWGRHKDQDPNGATIGAITEKTVLGVLARNPDPGVFAMRALLHHDNEQTKSATHYDVSATAANGSTATTATLQVKTACIGLCQAPYPEAHPQPDKHTITGRYVGSVILVSGCCDLGLGPNSMGRFDMSLPGSVCAEALGGKVRRGDTHRLDKLSERLLEVATNPTPARCGTKQAA